MNYNMALEERYVNPFTDFGFKKLFGTEINKDLVIDFLNQLLPEHHQIKDLSYTPTEQLGTTQVDRKAIFDLYCKSNTGERFIVEMQKAHQNYFIDRSVFYASFPIQEQAKKGAWDYQLAAVYTIGILDFVFDDNGDRREVLHEVKLKDQDCQIFYDKLTFIYLEMPNFTKAESELKTTFDKWLYVLKHLPDLQRRPAALQERVFKKLFETAEIAKFSRDEMSQYQNSLKYYRDMKNVIDYAFVDGREEGKAIGLEEGRTAGLEEGKREGKLEGKLEEKVEVVKRGLKAKMPAESIAAIVDMPLEEVVALIEKLQR